MRVERTNSVRCVLSKMMRRAAMPWFMSLLTIVTVSIANAQPPAKEREDIVVTGTLKDVQFLTGRSVSIKATVSDDVFAAGRYVTFEAATVNNAIAAGYDVELRGGNTLDFVAAAANLRIAGDVKDDLVAAARSIRIATDGSVGGDVRVAGEQIEVEGQIGGSLRAAARRVTITGKVSGKVDLLARRIVIGPKAIIAGDLIYRGKNKPEIADGAQIGGEVRQIAIELPDLKSVGWAVLGIGLLIALAWALATLILVIIFHWAFPHVMTNAASHLLHHPWSNLGRGIAIGLVVPAIAGLLMISVFGIPIGAALFLMLGIVWLVAIAVACAWIGLFIRRWRRGEADDIAPRAQLWWAMLGAVVLGVMALIPLLGWLLASLIVAAGLGAAAAELWQRLRHA